MLTKFSEFFQDPNGSLSSTRLAFLLWSIGVLAAWLYVSIKVAALQPLDESIIMIMGVFMTGKVAQRFTESKPEKPE